jgi:DnaJ-class molecular chaperone
LQVDTTKLYTALGLEKEATARDIKKAYMKLARTVSTAAMDSNKQ